MQTAIKRLDQVESAALEEYIGWLNNAVLTSVMYKRRDKGWLAVIKASFRRGPMVSFVQAGTLYELLEVVDALAADGNLHWIIDRPWNPSKRR